MNIGAGAGAYEPADRDVMAVEPSQVMVAQRPFGSAPVVNALAERLPFADDSFDAAMVVLSDFHWTDRLQGVRELARVARSRVVLFTWDPGFIETFWLARDYLPGLRRLPAKPAAELVDELADTRVEIVPIPHDCHDGFVGAFWTRPHAYLDPIVRAGMSVITLLESSELDAGLRRLRARHHHQLAPIHEPHAHGRTVAFTLHEVVAPEPRTNKPCLARLVHNASSR